MKDSHNYFHIISSMMYEMIQIWSDFVFQISHLASFLKNSSNEHFSSIKHLIYYLCETADYHIIYDELKDKNKNADLVEYSDSNFDACRTTRQSTGEYIFMLNRSSVSWSSKRQSTVALSTTETEYYALSQAVKKIFWLWKLLVSLKLYLIEMQMWHFYLSNISHDCMTNLLTKF